MADKDPEANVLANKIDAANLRRQSLERDILDQATAMVGDLGDRRTIFLWV